VGKVPPGAEMPNGSDREAGKGSCLAQAAVAWLNRAWSDFGIA